MTLCPVAAACLDACWLGELSQHPMCPHSAHRRRWNHHPLGDARHSTQPSPLGLEAGLIPCVFFFILMSFPLPGSQRGFQATSRTLPIPPFSAAACASAASLRCSFLLTGIVSLPSRTASAMNSSVCLSKWENTCCTITAG